MRRHAGVCRRFSLCIYYTIELHTIVVIEGNSITRRSVILCCVNNCSGYRLIIRLRRIGEAIMPSGESICIVIVCRLGRCSTIVYCSRTIRLILIYLKHRLAIHPSDVIFVHYTIPVGSIGSRTSYRRHVAAGSIVTRTLRPIYERIGVVCISILNRLIGRLLAIRYFERHIRTIVCVYQRDSVITLGCRKYRTIGHIIRSNFQRIGPLVLRSGYATLPSVERIGIFCRGSFCRVGSNHCLIRNAVIIGYDGLQHIVARLCRIELHIDGLQFPFA